MIIDIIGSIYERSGVDENGDALFADVGGYHVNTNEPIPNVEPLQVNTPFRKFAGVDVVYCYKFNSKEEFEALGLNEY